MSVYASIAIYKKDYMCLENITDQLDEKDDFCIPANVDDVYQVWYAAMGHSCCPVILNKEYDGKIVLEGEAASSDDVAKFINIKDFRSRAEREIQKQRDESFDRGSDHLKEIKRYRKRIESYRQLQKACTKDEEFAFDKWQEIIEELEEKIENLENAIKEECRLPSEDLLHIIDLAEKYLKKGYVVKAYLG